MSLADPQVLPAPLSLDLNRIGSTLGEFGSADANYELTVSHSRNSRSRHMVKLSQRKVATDPLLPSVNKEYSQSVHVVIDHPRQGFSSTEIVALTDVFVKYLSTVGLTTKLVQGQA